MSNYRYRRLLRWARARYAQPDGRVVIARHGQPTRYALIQSAAWLRYCV